MKTENNNLDLFEHYDKQPLILKNILDKYKAELIDGWKYSDLEDLLQEVNKISFTFDYYLDAEPYNLRAIK